MACIEYDIAPLCFVPRSIASLGASFANQLSLSILAFIQECAQRPQSTTDFKTKKQKLNIMFCNQVRGNPLRLEKGADQQGRIGQVERRRTSQSATSAVFVPTTPTAVLPPLPRHKRKQNFLHKTGRSECGSSGCK